MCVTSWAETWQSVRNKTSDISQCIHYDQFYVQLTVRHGEVLQNAANNLSDTRIFGVFVGRSHAPRGRDFSIAKALDVRRCGHFPTCYRTFDHLSVCLSVDGTATSHFNAPCSAPPPQRRFS